MNIFLRTLYILLALITIWLSGLIGYAISSIGMKSDVFEKADAIVVLTGGENRILKGLELFSQNYASNMLITGIHPDVSKSDIIQGFSDTLPKCCLTYGYEASNTVENGLETLKWAQGLDKLDSLILVTSEYHMNRGRQEIHHALPNVQIYSYPVKSSSPYSSYTFLRLVFLEYHKFLYRRFLISIGSA